MQVLLVETGKNKGKRVKLPDGESLVGRDEKCAVRIGSHEVSREHCLFRATPDRLFVRDLGSSNGTFVNGTAITEETELKPGDLVVVGPMGFRAQGSLPGLTAGPRKPVPAAASKTKAEQGLSDDEIAVWLTEGPPAGSSEDTAVIDVIPATASQPQPPIPTPKQRKAFKTVAEEAEDIIRRHQEARRAT